VFAEIAENLVWTAELQPFVAEALAALERLTAERIP
jgi:hypothetical protein